VKFTNQRRFHTENNPKGDYTLGIVTCDFDPYKCFIIEDTFREIKIPGETRFKAGLYPLALRKEDTPLTIKHRASYTKHPDGVWFKANPNFYHIEITKIPNYTGVYNHAGIDDKHTEGCQLHCYGFDLSKDDMPGSLSVKATNDFYALVYPLLIDGKVIWWEAKDEN
jgi:hypothetical protein